MEFVTRFKIVLGINRLISTISLLSIQSQYIKAVLYDKVLIIFTAIMYLSLNMTHMPNGTYCVDVLHTK